MKRLILKGDELLKRSGAENVHRLSLTVQMGAPTIYRYIKYPDQVKALDLAVFSQLVMRALNLTQAEFLNLKLKDLFEFKPEE